MKQLGNITTPAVVPQGACSILSGTHDMMEGNGSQDSDPGEGGGADGVLRVCVKKQKHKTQQFLLSAALTLSLHMPKDETQHTRKPR